MNERRLIARNNTIVIEDTCPGRQLPGQHGTTSRDTQRTGRIRSLKNRPLASQSIHVGGGYHWITRHTGEPGIMLIT
jgi:hypothetical protein